MYNVLYISNLKDLVSFCLYPPNTYVRFRVLKKKYQYLVWSLINTKYLYVFRYGFPFGNIWIRILIINITSLWVGTMENIKNNPTFLA